MNLFDKISVSGDDLLQAATDLVAGKGKLLPPHFGKHLHNLHDQGILSVVGGLTNIPFSDSPDIKVEGVVIWTVGGPNLLVGGCFRQLRSLFAFSNRQNFVAFDIN